MHTSGSEVELWAGVADSCCSETWMELLFGCIPMIAAFCTLFLLYKNRQFTNLYAKKFRPSLVDLVRVGVDLVILGSVFVVQFCVGIEPLDAYRSIIITNYILHTAFCIYPIFGDKTTRITALIKFSVAITLQRWGNGYLWKLHPLFVGILLFVPQLYDLLKEPALSFWNALNEKPKDESYVRSLERYIGNLEGQLKTKNEERMRPPQQIVWCKHKDIEMGMKQMEKKQKRIDVQVVVACRPSVKGVTGVIFFLCFFAQMDPNFVVRHKRKLTVYREGQVRRDPNFKHQHYFFSCVPPMGASKFVLYFSQAVAASANPSDQSLRTIEFLKRKRITQIQVPDVTFALDERAAKFYFGFGHNPNNRPDSPFSLKIFDLDFDPVDHLGYRRIRIRGEDRQYTIEHPPLVQSRVVGTELCPVTGKLFGHCVMHGCDKASIALAQIEEPKVDDSVLKTKLSDYKLETANASRSLCARGSLFSSPGHLVLFYGFPGGLVDEQTEKKVFFCSYSTEDLNLVRCLAFNPVDLVSQFFPEVGMSASDATAIGQRLRMTGRMHKYVLFQFESYILAAKWPKHWYMGEHLPPVQLSRAISLEDFMDHRQIYDDPPTAPFALTKHHLYVLFRLRDKPHEVRRLFLGQRFKDYRHCANCGEVEERKRRNKDGKRIAKFKVCRLCKKKNFHLFFLDLEIGCHYCSDE